MALLLVFGGVSKRSKQASISVGMEAAYAPLNWTQDDDSNGAVPIEGTKQYASRMTLQIAKKIEAQGKKPLVVKSNLDRLIPALTSGKIDHDYRWYESTALNVVKKLTFQIATITEVSLLWLLALMVIMPTLKSQKTSDAKSQLNRVYLYNLIDRPRRSTNSYGRLRCYAPSRIW